MQRSQAAFKAPPKKFQPHGLSILYEDRDIIVADKINGLLTMSRDNTTEKTAYCLLNNYVRRGNIKSRERVFIVHRLDRDASGVIVMAKNEDSRDYLQERWEGFKKKYIALINGALPDKEGIITSYLAENSVHRMYSVADPARGKLARTGYKVLRQSKRYSLIEIDLLSDRKNQIRVHFSEKGCPVSGDKKYGIKEKGVKRLALHSAELTILHPYTGKEMSFTAKIPPYFETLMNL